LCAKIYCVTWALGYIFLNDCLQIDLQIVWDEFWRSFIFWMRIHVCICEEGSTVNPLMNLFIILKSNWQINLKFERWVPFFAPWTPHSKKPWIRKVSFDTIDVLLYSCSKRDVNWYSTLLVFIDPLGRRHGFRLRTFGLDQWFSTQIAPRPVYLKKNFHDPQLIFFD